MSDELIEGRPLRNKPLEPESQPEPPAPEGRKSRLKGKPQRKAEDEKSGPYVTLVPPDEAVASIRAETEQPTFHKGMQPVVQDETTTPETEADSSALAPDLPWEVFEPAPEAPPAEPAAEPIMKLPRVPVEEAPAEPHADGFVPHFHTPTDELPAVPDEVEAEEPPKSGGEEFIPHFRTPTDELPPVADEVEAEEDVQVAAAAKEEDETEAVVEEREIPPIRRVGEALTPGILRPVPDEDEEEEEIPPIRRGRRSEARDEARGAKESLALDDDSAGALPVLRRMHDEPSGEVVDADWVREVGAQPPKRRGRGVEEAIAEKLEARRAKAKRTPSIRLKLNTRTILTGISILAIIALLIYVPSRLGLFGGQGGDATPTSPAPTEPGGSAEGTPPGDVTLTTAAQSFGRGRMVFASNRDGNYEIYVMDMSTGAITRLTNNAAADRNPAWSPDGRQIVYVSNSSGNDDLYIIPSTGGAPVQLTSDPGSDRSPAWSPDGRVIISTRENVEGSRLMSMPVSCIVQPTTCEQQMKLLTPGGYDRFPAWSPDGSKLAFTASDLPGGASVIALLNPDGSGYVSFTGTKTSDLSPAWSPDGKRIAFLSYAEGDYDLWLMNSDGLSVTQITRSQAADGAPAWSPDGGYLVFASDRGDGQHFNLYLLSASCIAVGSCEDNLVRLTDQPADDLDPSLTP